MFCLGFGAVCSIFCLLTGDCKRLQSYLITATVKVFTDIKLIRGITIFLLINSCALNRPSPSCPWLHFQNESLRKTIQMTMSLICMKVDLQLKLIFICMVSHEDSV